MAKNISSADDEQPKKPVKRSRPAVTVTEKVTTQRTVKIDGDKTSRPRKVVAKETISAPPVKETKGNNNTLLYAALAIVVMVIIYFMFFNQSSLPQPMQQRGFERGEMHHRR